MSDDALIVERNGAILEVTVNRPKANAIDNATSIRMGEIFAGFRDDPALRVAIVTGAGEKFFSAGWDLKAAAEGTEYDDWAGIGGFGGYPELPGLYKPVIAAVNGMAVGGGFELALAADLVVAAEHAQLFLPETRVGIMPDAGAIRLARLLPRPIAMEVLVAGRRIDAEEACRWGLVNHVARADELMERARTLAAEIVSGAPLAVAAVKETTLKTEGMTVAEAFRRLRAGDIVTYQQMLRSEDAKEGPKAFAEKRDPIWTGR